MSEKEFGHRVWDFLGSRKLSVFLFIAGITYVLILVVFSLFIPLPWVNSIARLLPFKVLYILFFVNLIICEIKWIPVIVRRCRKPDPPARVEALKSFVLRVTGQSFESRVGEIEKYLRRRLYRVKMRILDGEQSEHLSSSRSDNILFAYKGRFSPIGSLLFHLSFLLILVGVMVSLTFRFEGTARVTEGYLFSGSGGEYSSMNASSIISMPNVSFFLKKITPEFWEDQMLFTDLKADIISDKRIESVSMSSPVSLKGADITLQGVSMTPMYLLKDNWDKNIDMGYVNLAVFSPGSEDHFQIPGFPHKIFVSFYPDHEIVNGQIMNRSMNPVNPAYRVRVVRGRIPVFTGVLKPGEAAHFEDLSLSFPRFRYWGDFRIVKDPGLPFVWVAFIVFGIGLVWRLFFYRREIVLVREGDAYLIYGRSDYYPHLFGTNLNKLAKKFEAI